MLRLSRKARMSKCTGPVRYASRSSRTRFPVNTNDTRRRSFRSMRESGQPTVERKAARKRSFVIMVEVDAGRLQCPVEVWYFLDICSPFGAFWIQAADSSFSGEGQAAFLFSKILFCLGLSIAKQIIFNPSIKYSIFVYIARQKRIKFEIGIYFIYDS